MPVTPEQLRYHADRSAAAGAHATALFCRDAADEIERLRSLLADAIEAATYEPADFAEH